MSRVYRLPPNRGPVARLLSALLLLGALMFALFLGTFIFIVMLGVAVVLAVVLYLRFWWLRRKLVGRGPREPTPGGGVTLEGEYTVGKRDGQRPGR